MQRSICIPVFPPSISPRRGRGVRLKLPNIAWAAALIAVGVGPASVIAENERPTTTTTLHNASGAFGIGTGGKKARSKAGRGLSALHNEYQAYLQQAAAQARGPSGFRSRNMAPTAAGYVSIDTAATGDPQVLAADLEALGLEGGAVFGRMVSGHLPMSAIPALEALDSLQFAHPAYAMAQAGAVTSQGDAAIRADIARNAFGVDGTGVTVGVLSNTFNCLGGAAAGLASGDLPAAIAVLEEGPCGGQGLISTFPDEGRAIAEIVHDVAPGAAIAFHTADRGQANFALGILDLANFGAQVITDDIFYFAEPMFQDGIISQAVDQVKARGVSYFSAAQNEGRRSYESAFRRSGIGFNVGFGPEEAHDFDPGPGIDVCQQITIPTGEGLNLVFQWDQPFFSVSGAPGSQSDMDILLVNAACDTFLNDGAIGNIMEGFDFNVGNDPFELVGFTNPGPATTFGVIILKGAGPDPGLMKTVFRDTSRAAQITIDEFDTRSGTTLAHANSQGGLGVGAAFYRETPAFGTTPPVPRIQAFSSAGGVPILFDTAGNRLPVPQLRQQPALVAPDGVNTTFRVGFEVEGDGFPNFFGTSAAAPHAAGVAALLKNLNPLASPDDIYNVLKAAAIDMDDPETPGFDTGFDFRSGFGLIRADVTFGPPPPPPPFEAEPARPRFNCRSAARCGVPVTCNLAQIAGNCANPIEIFVPRRALRTAGEALTKGPTLIPFGASVTNVPPGAIGNVRLTLPKRIRNFVRKSQKKSIRGVLQIRSAAGTAIETRRIKIRLK
jgi:subtilisin family serine protease